MESYVNLLQSRADGGTQPELQLTLDTARQLSLALDQHLLQTKTNILDTLRTNSETYTSSISNASRAQQTISTLLAGVDDLQDTLGSNNSETSIYQRLSAAIQREHRIQHQLDGNRAVIDALKQLSIIRNNLHSLEAWLSKEETHMEAAKLLDEMEGNQMGGVLGERIRARLVLARAVLRDEVVERVVGMIGIGIGIENGTVRINAVDPAVFDCCRVLREEAAVQSAVAEHFISEFVRPLSQSPMSIAKPTTKAVSDPPLAPEYTVPLSDNNRGNTGSSPAALCDAILGALAFISEQIPQIPLWSSSEFLSDISRIVLERFLLRCIPENQNELSAFVDDVAPVLRNFERKLWQQTMGGSSSSSGGNGDSANASKDKMPISEALDQLPQLYTDHRHSVALSKTRELAEDSRFATYWMPEHEIHNIGAQEESGGRGICVFPQCAISQSMRALVELAQELLLDASLAEGSDILVCNVMVLYRVVFTSVHAAALLRVPALGWQFYLDCLYGAHHTAIMAQKNQNQNQNQNDCWSSCISAYVHTAQAHKLKLIDQFRLGIRPVDLTSILQSSSPSKDQQPTSPHHQHVKQAQSTLLQLSHALRPPATPPYVYAEALGGCFDAVCRSSVDSIMVLEDIGVEESQLLSQYCRDVLGISNQLVLDEKATAPYRELMSRVSAGASIDGCCGMEVEEERKGVVRLRQLADILEISRADIVARHRAGILDVFSADELVHLVRALFSDTPERSRDIELLKK
ncbi:Centromere/kinetochore protein zw10 [Kickxella alabastrina]|uniref:Centromere/kinetochore protein zw10 n=1 Tax=Kickxella alabastrina TaxID=61397 RepID=A0ACC1IQC9_9FUNG|nr:Centromere/kinetochore protein zw10 [Kickxella alabastrina]